MQNKLILSLFSGIDLLGEGFKNVGFCVVSGGDIILNQDVRNFKNVPKNQFYGIIGGSPCQDFSKARRTEPTGYGLEMLAHFQRIVFEAQPVFFLLENVPTVPDISIDGYQVQRFDLCPSELGESIRRKRHFQFGTKEGYLLQFQRNKAEYNLISTITASEGKRANKRTFSEFCKLQGLQKELKLPDLTKKARYKVVGNGVHLTVSNAIAQQVARLSECQTFQDTNICSCGCGRIIKKNRKTASDACRKRVSVKRKIEYKMNPSISKELAEKAKNAVFKVKHSHKIQNNETKTA